MTAPPVAAEATKSRAGRATQAPWLALIIIVLAQLQMGINVNALPVSLGPIAEDLNVPSTAMATALVLYALFVAAFVMLGAKLGKLFGERLVFQLGVAANYHGRQQETALGVLAGIPAIASGLTFVIAGFIATVLSWRYSFGLTVFLAIAVLILSFRLEPLPRQSGVGIDLIGVVLSAGALALILIGFNSINS